MGCRLGHGLVGLEQQQLVHLQDEGWWMPVQVLRQAWVPVDHDRLLQLVRWPAVGRSCYL